LPFGKDEIVSPRRRRQTLKSRARVTGRRRGAKMQLSRAKPAFSRPIAAEIPYRAG